jgi:putative endonuclease
VTFARQRLGERGETLACEELERLGYHVLTRRYRTRYGEIDVVCLHEDVLVFVEVKARSSGDFGHPADAVTAQKQRRVAAMAETYMAMEGVRGRLCRFDVVAVETDVNPPVLTVFRDAFRPGWL